MKLLIVSDLELTFYEGSPDNPNGAVVISGKDADGSVCEYRLEASTSPLGDLTGKYLEPGQTVDAVVFEASFRYVEDDE